MSNHKIEITDLSIFPVPNRTDTYPVLAFVRIVLNDAFVVKGLRVIGGKFGPFVAFPSEKGKNVTICFPILQNLHEEMSRAILTEYWRVLFLSQKEKEEQVG